MKIKTTSPHRIPSSTAVMLIAGILASAPASSALANPNLESHGSQGAIDPGLPSNSTVPGIPVQYSAGQAPPASDDGGADWDNCMSTDEGGYVIGSLELGKRYGTGFWRSESASGATSYNPYGSYQYVMVALEWKDHPTETDAAGIFLGGSYIIGQALPASRAENPASSPVTGPEGVRGGVRIEFPGLGEIGELLRNTLSESLLSPEGAQRIGLSDPDNVDLAELDWPELNLSGALLQEISASANGLGMGAGRYDSGEIDLTCMATEAVQLAGDELDPWVEDDLAPWVEEYAEKNLLRDYFGKPVADGIISTAEAFPEWYIETSVQIDETVTEAGNVLRDIFDPSFDVPIWGR